MSFGKLIVEPSPSSKCVCATCEKVIEAKTMRLVEIKGSGKWAKTTRYCAECGHLRLDAVSTEIVKLNGELGVFKA